MTHSGKKVVSAVLFALTISVAGRPAKSQQSELKDAPPAQVFPQFTDPSQADIFGVRVHMSAREAMSVLEKRFHGKWVSQCITQSHRTFLSERAPLCAVEKETQLTPGRRFTQHLEINADGIHLIVELLEGYPYDSDKPEEVYSVRYVPSRMSTTEDFSTFFEETREKFGPPMWSESKIALWCNYGRAYGGRYECDEDAVRMEISITNGLELRDPSLEKEYQADCAKSHPETLPAF